MICPACFLETFDNGACSACGFDESAQQSPLLLPPGTPLMNGQYLVGKILGKPGGFGITYLGWDSQLATFVAIKEYLPREVAGRHFDRRCRTFSLWVGAVFAGSPHVGPI